MYAVIETGGKQYTVEYGDELEVELLDAEPGQEINLDRVLLVVDGDKSAVGQPVVKNAAVSAVVLRRDRGEKTISFKYRPKARRRVKKGHRQELTVLQITDVRLGSKSAAKEAKEAEAAAAAERAKVSKAAARQAAEDAALAEKLKARKAAAAEEEAEAKGKAKAPAKGAKGAAKGAAAEEEGPAEDETPAKTPKGAAKSASKTAPAKEESPTKGDAPAKAVPAKTAPAKGEAPTKAAPAKAAPAKAGPKAAKTDEPGGNAAPAGEASKRPARTKKDE
jgi:large subunit ribosomal protein L21